MRKKKIISDYLLSPTWLAIEYLLNRNGDKSSLHMGLLIVLDRDNGITIGFAAHNAEKELGRLIKQYNEELLTLKKNIYTMLPEISEDNVDRLAQSAYNAVKSEISYNDEYAKDAFRYLKEEKGVHDTNLDIFLAVLDNDEKLLKEAIDAGGSLGMDDKSLLKKYERLLEDRKFERRTDGNNLK